MSFDYLRITIILYKNELNSSGISENMMFGDEEKLPRQITNVSEC